MKKLLLTLSLLIAPTIAIAQTQEFTFKLTPQEADIVWEGLRELPVKRVESLMLKFRQQAAEQQQVKSVEPKPELSKE